MVQQPAPGTGKSLDAIADQLEQLVYQIRETDPNPVTISPTRGDASGSTDYLTIARKLYHIRRKRVAIFGSIELFGEPAWDLLLDLYIAHATGSELSVSSACIGAAVPATTALRYLGILQREGLILREQDPRDQRRINVRLSRFGIERMEAYFSEIAGRAVDGEAQRANASRITAVS